MGTGIRQLLLVEAERHQQREGFFVILSCGPAFLMEDRKRVHHDDPGMDSVGHSSVPVASSHALPCRSLELVRLLDIVPVLLLANRPSPRRQRSTPLSAARLPTNDPRPMPL